MRYFQFIALFGLLAFVSGCKHYQIFSFTSEQVNIIEKKGFFVNSPEDSIQIHYRWFAGDNSGVVDVENTSNQMVYVDLAHSSVVVNGIKQGLFAETSETKVNALRNIKKLTPHFYSTGGNMFQNKRNYKTQTLEAQNQQVVLPNSKSRYWLPTPSLYYQNPRKDTAFRQVNMTESASNQLLSFNKKDFDKQNSPILLRIFLMYQVGKEGKYRTVDKTFWLHQVVDTKEINTVKKLCNDKKAPPIDKNSFNKLIIKR
ncbi:MAG: hypothetical protein EAZ95_03800 [Bacteroidetes bacterium]|nr:MAG: hypothetical protein EAZ95_03800 [Bacteroidota bacterium]